MAEIVILPALAIGALIGLYEAILLHRDVSIPTHRFGHTLHAFVYAIIAVFITMNAPWVYANLSFLHSIPILQHAIVFQIAVGLITVIKIHGTSFAVRSRFGMASVGMAETWTHSFVVGALVVAAPYVWPFIQPMMPAWLK
ncbi:hypothetical protein JW851_03565 [Candidatus Woesearchaeota archaeon]|nr:hypothetical protein [Candidatus Woesearchaeota archaeon]